MLGQKKVLEEEKKRLIFDQSKMNAMTNENQTLYNKAINFLENKITESKGRIIVDLQNDATYNGAQSIQIEDEDHLHIPVIPSTVQIVGAVTKQTSVIFKNSSSPRSYIKQAGGFSEFANKSKVYAFRANGSVALNPKGIHLGDTVYIPQKIKVRKNYLRDISLITKTAAELMVILKVLSD